VQTVPKGARLQEISAGIQEAVSAAVLPAGILLKELCDGRGGFFSQ